MSHTYSHHIRTKSPRLDIDSQQCNQKRPTSRCFSLYEDGVFFLSSVTGLSNDAQQYDLRLMGIHVTSKFSPKMRVKVKVWTKNTYW